MSNADLPFLDVVAGIASMFRVAGDARRRDRATREIIRHNLRCHLAKRHATKPALSFVFMGRTITANRAQLDALRSRL